MKNLGVTTSSKISILGLMMKKTYLLSMVFGLLLVASACQQEEKKSLVLSETPILNASPAWAVVTKPYIRAYAQASNQASIVSIFRIGDLLQVSSDTAELSADQSSWRKVLDAGDGFKVEEAMWVQLSGISLYELKAKAQLAARNLTTPHTETSQAQ